MTHQKYLLLAAGGSAALLGGAFVFQLLGYAPCAMCLWQRWPHAAAIVIGLLALVLGWRALAWLGALAAAITSGIGVYHTGVERGWWEGPASCTGTGSGLGTLDGGDLLSLDAPALVLCDQVSWEFLTLSMASWNALFSAILVVFWIKAALQRD
ncbi:disulfide bond formation protein B [Flavimaricola marinus]|uniref:Disulfide bond formation protein B n=1 Tax=Flavimaricola marinus TaxID=1819565 RepID=A0A238LDG8_9RHOB|nr:disulfide bond formation protein B [Flavimaricola marinus]SMY07464.1 disulfide bond formation protein B [Flavimaricola marinus]